MRADPLRHARTGWRGASRTRWAASVFALCLVFATDRVARAAPDASGATHASGATLGQSEPAGWRAEPLSPHESFLYLLSRLGQAATLPLHTSAGRALLTRLIHDECLLRGPESAGARGRPHAPPLEDRPPAGQARLTTSRHPRSRPIQAGTIRSGERSAVTQTAAAASGKEGGIAARPSCEVGALALAPLTLVSPWCSTRHEQRTPLSAAMLLVSQPCQ